MEQAVEPTWNRDTIIGVVGAAVLIGSMVGIFLYERGQFQTYEISWASEEGQRISESTTLQTSDSEEVALVVEDPRAATVQAELTWTDDQGQPDTFRLELTGPQGQQEIIEGEEGSLSLTVPVSQVPELQEATGRSLEDARAQAVAAVNASAGQGTWTATVTLVSAPGEESPVGGVETQGDGQNRFELVVTQTSWAPGLTPRR